MTASHRCPICDTPVTPPDRSPAPLPRAPQPSEAKKSFFPFCSDRCRMVDLGRWLTGQYAIPGESADPEDEKSPPLPKDPDEPE